MASRRIYEFFWLYLLSIFVVSSCETEEFKNLEGAELRILDFSRRELLQLFFPKETIHENIEPPVIYPSPPNIPAPPVVNIPPPAPLITVIPDPTTVPEANPTATPVPLPTSSSSPPRTDPVTQPVMPPPVITNPPTNPGRGWCVAKSGVPQAALQAALDYACGAGGVDCSVLQQGGSCYNPVTLENHASYAFNSYYQRNPVPTSCDFGGTAMIISTNPSFGACVFPTSSSASSVPPPFIQIPIQTPPTPSTTPTPPAFYTPPAAPTPPEFYMAPAAPTPPVSPTPPASLRPPASPSPSVSSPVTAVPRASGYPVSTNSTNNSTSGFPWGGFPNVFPIVNISMPPDSPPSVTSLSKPSTLPQPFIGGVILLTTIVTWNHLLDL